MLTTRACTLLGIAHPIVLGGMSGPTTPGLVAAVSEAGGLGIYGATGLTPEELARLAEAIRERTARPFGLNLLLFQADDAGAMTTGSGGVAPVTGWSRRAGRG